MALGETVATANKRLSEVPAFRLIFRTVLATLVIRALVEFLTSGRVKETFLRKIFKLARRIPMVRREVDKALRENKQSFRKSFVRQSGEDIVVRLPEEGLPANEVLRRAKEIEKVNLDWTQGHVTGAVYHGGPELTKMLVEVTEQYYWTNPLHADIFPGLKKMEAEVVAMCVAMYNGGPKVCGTMTSGGTESIIMAIKAYRDWARAEKGITKPNMVVPVSAHAAFDKGCQYFGVRLVRVPGEGQPSGAVDPKKLDRACDRNTIAIAGSAVQFPLGLFDPIPALAAIARRRKIGLHVDSCLGSFLVPFLEEVERETGDVARASRIPKFDFRVDGVTTVSCDTHKYGYAPKGSSVIMYSTQELRRHQYYVNPDWPGGIYASPTMAGSRAGTPVAGAWAALMYMGRSGYKDAVTGIVAARRKIVAGVEGIHGLRMAAEPQSMVVAFTSDLFEIYRLDTAMGARGWHLNKLQFPPAMNIILTHVHSRAGVAERLVSDLTECTAEIMKDPNQPPTGAAAMYGLAAKVPDRSLVGDLAAGFFDVYYTAKWDDEKEGVQE